MYFSAAHSSENDQGNMNLASNTAPVGSTTPSRVAPIQRRRGCRTHRWTCLTAYPVLHSYQRRLTCSVATPSWTSKFPDKSSGSSSPRFSRHSRVSASSSFPIMIRASEPPMYERRSWRLSRSGNMILPSFAWKVSVYMEYTWVNHLSQWVFHGFEGI